MIIDRIEFWTIPNAGANTKHFTVGLEEVPLTNSYILEEADGLDADLIYTQFYGVAGDWQADSPPNRKYYNLKPGPRVVTFKIKLNPQYNNSQSPASLRETLQKMIAFSRGGTIQIRFVNSEDIVGVLDGFIAKFDAPLFTKDSSVTITFSCIYPFFRSLTEVNVASEVTMPNLVVNDPFSTAPHGFRAKFTFLGNVSGPVVIDGQFDHPGVSPFTIGFNFLTGDQLYFNSEPDKRSLYVVRGGNPIYLMDKVVPSSIWPMIFPGFNRISFPINATLNELYHYYTYWGV